VMSGSASADISDGLFPAPVVQLAAGTGARVGTGRRR
jgi:hypothetical protein